MGYTASELIKIAEAEVGYLEKKTNANLDSKTENAGTNNWTKYARDLYAAGYYNGNKNGHAWCDVFHDYCHYIAAGKSKDLAQKVTCQTGSLGAGCKYSANYYRKANRFFDSPKVGDQIFFGTKGSETHTGIVYKVDSKKVYTIEGNTSGASGVIANGGGVCKKSYALDYSKIVGYGRPLYDAEEVKTTKGETTVNIELTVLKKGAEGGEVKTLQRLLIALGYDLGKSGADGDFGSATEKAVLAFQKAKKLGADGIVGKNTWNKLLKG